MYCNTVVWCMVWIELPYECACMWWKTKINWNWTEDNETKNMFSCMFVAWVLSLVAPFFTLFYSFLFLLLSVFVQCTRINISSQLIGNSFSRANTHTHTLARTHTQQHSQSVIITMFFLLTRASNMAHCHLICTHTRAHTVSDRTNERLTLLDNKTTTTTMKIIIKLKKTAKSEWTNERYIGSICTAYETHTRTTYTNKCNAQSFVTLAHAYTHSLTCTLEYTQRHAHTH